MSSAALLFDELFDGPASSKVEPAPKVDFRAPVGAGSELAIAGDAYEGAALNTREMAMWQPRNRSADADIMPAKRTSDARVKDIVRNDAYVRSGITLHQDNLVGAMFMLNAKPRSRTLTGKVDEKFEQEFQEEIEEKFTLTAESPENWFDAARRMSFTEMVRHTVGTHTGLGEYLWNVEWVRDDIDRRPCNTALRSIDLDRLSTPADMLSNPYVVGGVELNKRRVPTGYYVRKAHPSDLLRPEAFQWAYLPARKPWGRLQVIHGFEQQRPDQTRGISDMVAALKEMRQTKQFRETVLQNAVVNATYAATIESDLDPASIFERLGGGNLGQEDIDTAVTNYMGAYMSAVSAYIGDKKQFQIGGVRIPHLPPGSKLQLRGAGQGGPLGSEFEQSLLRYIAANLGVSYEQLSRDYTQTNYSSARAAMTETWKFMQSRKRMVADKFATYVYRLWLEEMINKGMIESLPRKYKRQGDSSWLYDGLNFDALSFCQWIGAGRGQIDELKETQAAVLRLKMGLSTYEDEMGRLGNDWRSTVRQIAREKALFDDQGVSHANDVQDPSINAASGTGGANGAKDQKGDNSSGAKGGILNGTVENMFFDAEHDDPDERPGKENADA